MSPRKLISQAAGSARRRDRHTPKLKREQAELFFPALDSAPPQPTGLGLETETDRDRHSPTYIYNNPCGERRRGIQAVINTASLTSYGNTGLDILAQVHPCVKISDVIFIAVKHQCGHTLWNIQPPPNDCRSPLGTNADSLILWFTLL